MARTSAVLPPCLLGALALLFCALAAAPAHAQSASDAAAARALFNEGVTLADAEDWPAAVDRFERALALRDSAVIAFNLALALEHVGRWVEASERFRRVIRDESADEAMRAQARAGLTDAEAQVAFVSTSWSGAHDGLSFFFDDAERPYALFGTSMPVDPGSHRFELRDSVGPVASGSITIAAGEHGTLELTTVERDEAVPTPVDEEPVVAATPPPPDDPTPWIALGVTGGVVLVAGAIVLAVVLTPTPEAAPFQGSLGTVEIGR